jgi:hypothetical protein
MLYTKLDQVWIDIGLSLFLAVHIWPNMGQNWALKPGRISLGHHTMTQNIMIHDIYLLSITHEPNLSLGSGGWPLKEQAFHLYVSRSRQYNLN